MVVNTRNGTEWTEWPTENNDPTGDELILQNITASLVDQKIMA